MQMNEGRSTQVATLASLEACDVRVVDPDKVAATRERLPSLDETDRLADWFKVLGDATRARILYAVLEAGELCVCDLAATVDVPESTVSHALRWLRGAGVVRARRSGKMMYYSLDDEPTANLDSGHGRDIARLLRQLAREDRRSIVIVSHDNRLREVADRVLWLEDGAFGELEHMPVDPMCGMAVDRSTALSAEIDGELWWFCSAGCSTDFRNRQPNAEGSAP